MRWQILIPALAFILAADPREAMACSCDEYGPPCQNYFQSDVVFVGTVQSVTPIPGSGFDARVRVEFQDAVPSRGVDGTSMTVFTSDNSASCGYAFTPGERYVVYGSRSKDGTRIHTSICSRTRRLTEADEDVRFFDTLSTPTTGARVFGTITHWEQDVTRTRSRDYGPVGNVDVTLRGADRSFQARTDQNGRYELTGIPSGRYDLTAAPPPPYSTAYLKRQFELRDPRACFSADFGLRYDSRVSGSIVGADGKPAAGAIVEILPVEQIGNPVYVPPETMTADEAGLFEMTEVSPGRYILGVNLRQETDSEVVTPTIYHAEARDPAKATVFEVRGGERVQLGRIVVPAAPPAYRISGTVRFADGQPAAGATIALFDGNARWKQVAAEAVTDVNGAFSFLVHEGLAYIANARYTAPGMPGRTRAAGSVAFVGSETLGTIELVLRMVR